ncbi:hypothetical protein CDAR_603261 [Caerostris darwini]|uniref:Uncharacterized protein n=1 Tax=Caerostris darwini TaxID=1538125 RepID=A0AAV4PL51_9ARAC|nr:hypothetical protein CDAR_603261 [Caerostris darwini]
MRYPKRENKRALVLEDINHTNRYQLPLSRLPEHKSSPPPFYPPPHQGRFVFHYGPPYSVSLIGCLGHVAQLIIDRKDQMDGLRLSGEGGGSRRLKEVLQQDRCMRGQSCAVFIWRESVTNYLCLESEKSR